MKRRGGEAPDAKRRKPRSREVELDVVRTPRSPCLTLLDRQLAVAERELVIAAWVEVGKLVDSIEHVTDELAQEDARGQPDGGSEFAGDSRGELNEIRVVYQPLESLLGRLTQGIDVPDFPSHIDETP